MRVLGLDLGEKTIGVAVSDELGLIAYPRRTLRRTGNKSDSFAVANVAQDESAERIVIGLPLTLEGTVGPAARRVIAFVEALRKVTKIPVETWDERFSTAAVERVLIEANVSREKRKEVIDKQAAAYILQGWLDAQRSAG
jgi:putative holliday junction resolvase